MSYWNYRIVKRTVDDAVTFGVHEVFFNDRNEIESWTGEPVEPAGESLGELREDVFHFMSAFRRPVLVEASEGGKHRLIAEHDESPVTRDHYHEAMDRASVVMAHFDEFVASHPAVRANGRLKEAAQRTVDALYAFYSEAAEAALG
jgi:hypothetical protein